MLSLLSRCWRRWPVRFDPLNPSLTCAASSIDFDRCVELVIGSTVLTGRIQRPTPVMQRLGFLEWHMISAKNLYCFFELPLGLFVFSLSRCDDSLCPRDVPEKPAPVLPISEYLAATIEMLVRSLRVAILRMNFCK